MSEVYKWSRFNIKQESYQERQAVTKYRDVKKTRQVTKYRTETKYRDETKTRQVTKKDAYGQGGFSTRDKAALAASSKAASSGWYVLGTTITQNGTGGTWGYVIRYEYKTTESYTERVPYTERIPYTATEEYTEKEPYTDYEYVTKYRDVKGSYYDDVVSEDRNAYPDNGKSGSYFYEYKGLANRPPAITGSNTKLGSVKSDFKISYTVTDPDGDEVKVKILVDDRVIQYPIAVTLNKAQTVNIRLSDYSLGEHTITVTATDSSNASASRVYHFNKDNQAPSISGSDLDMGGVSKDLNIEYIVQDANGDSVKVEIKVDGVVKQASTPTSLGVRKTFNLPIKSVDLGRHNVEIIAMDSQGASSVRTYSFQRVNSAPVISGNDVNLGAKNTGFSYKYQVNDSEKDSIKVVEKINGNIIRTMDNAALGQDHVITISNEQIVKFPLNKENTIEIEATDGMAKVYRRVTFVRNNMPPIIADKDKDLGKLKDKFSYNYSATDPEKDPLSVEVYLDGQIYSKKKALKDGEDKRILIDGKDWIKLKAGKHKLEIVVEDDKGFKSKRTISFTKVIDRLVVELADKGIKTDALAKRVFVATAGVYVAQGAKVKYEVCNNSLDEAPKWEDATSAVLENKAYVFTNKEKKASQAGVNIRVTITKGESKAPSYVSNLGGTFD